MLRAFLPQTAATREYNNTDHGSSSFLEGASIIVSLLKAGVEACRAVHRYPNEAARIGSLLTWILARADK